MKKYFAILLSLAALPLFQSCVGPGYYSSGYGSATSYDTSVGIIATSHSRWGYDPFYRSYYDYSLGQYYDLNRGRYYTTLPTRYSSPYYPTYYSRGSVLRCPTNLPYLSTRYTRPAVTFVSTGNSRWAYDPYRRSYYDHQNKRYFNTSSRSYYNSLPKRYSTPSYPNGHRSGAPVQLPSSLPYVSNRSSSSGSRDQRGYSSSRDQRPSPSSRYQQQPSSSSRGYQSPTLTTPSYRSRSSVNTQPSVFQRSRTTIPSRESARTQIAPQGRSLPSVTRQRTVTPQVSPVAPRVTPKQYTPAPRVQIPQERVRREQPAPTVQPETNRGFRGKTETQQAPSSRGSRGGGSSSGRGKDGRGIY